MKSSRTQLSPTAQHPVACKRLLFAAALLLVLSACQALAQITKNDFKFVNVADSTQGFGRFSQFPAINNRGAVAFVATRIGQGQGVFKWRHGRITTIAQSGGLLSSFGDDVVINAAGVVGYDANVSTGVSDRAIFTSNGIWTKTIVDATQQGFIGRFLGSPSINDSGTVAFFASRNNFSQAVFTGDGGALTNLADTTNTNFIGFGNTAINNSGEVTFPGSRDDGSVGVFIATPVEEHADEDGAPPVTPGTIRAIGDPSNPIFSDPFLSFGDPVINQAGIVADVAFLSGGKLEIFTGDDSGTTARTDPSSPFFTSSEHPSINNRGAVAFYANELSGGVGIFVELTGGASPVAVIEAGDALFGSTVTGLDLGRFALNDHDQLAIHYDLQDGRSGVAIVSLHKEEKEERESER